jgi:hypothetical protein
MLFEMSVISTNLRAFLSQKNLITFMNNEVK